MFLQWKLSGKYFKTAHQKKPQPKQQPTSLCNTTAKHHELTAKTVIFTGTFCF